MPTSPVISIIDEHVIEKMYLSFKFSKIVTVLVNFIEQTFPSSSTVISPSLSQSKSLKASLRHSMSCLDSCLSGLSRSVFLVILTVHWSWRMFLTPTVSLSSTTPITLVSTLMRVTVDVVSPGSQDTKLTTTSLVSPWARPSWPPAAGPAWPACWPAATPPVVESCNKVGRGQNQNKFIQLDYVRLQKRNLPVTIHFLYIHFISVQIEFRLTIFISSPFVTGAGYSFNSDKILFKNSLKCNL